MTDDCHGWDRGPTVALFLTGVSRNKTQL